MKATAVVTAYHPDDLLAAVVESALKSCQTVIVSDNTPPGSSSAAAELTDQRVTVLTNGSNRGLGGALNAAMAVLPEDTDTVLFLDQDSVLPPELVPSLAARLDADGRIGVVAPTPWDAEHGGSYEKAAATGPALADRDGVMTSGMLVRRAALDKVGRFREDFFVDWVDFDFCMRVRAAGYRVVQDTTVLLPHSLGDRREHRLGPWRVHVLHYPVWRHYWVARNATVLAREQRNAWSLSAVLYLARWTFNTAVFEPRRRTHVPALLRGFADGLTGRFSPKYLPAGAQYSAR